MSDDFEATAQQLRFAYAEGPIAPLREVLAADDVDGAYAVQTINTNYWQAHGRRLIGRKIGLTARVVQQQLGVDQPDFGVLFSDMQISDGGVLPSSQLLQPMVEAEVALVMGSDLYNPNAGIYDVLRAVAYAVPALEIVDSRIRDWKITFADTVADNASSGYFVLGSESRSLHGLDLRTCGMVLEIDEKLVSLGAGAACLGHPLEAAAWLARTLAQRGDRLRAGDIVLTGALGPMAVLPTGSRVRATIGGLGSVGFFFAGE
ncbi:TPA: fumarylacetoacetate hydrolase family protein [Burkholderia cepacia]|uniref:2-keto-4-pentenoate hydratase n=1 Tax=Burkholderia cepacia TaxID=292 RepID=UPI001CF3FAE4|nr:fumarylacetoacetate hydrolase family protein [Burkholderia cepacia]MCA8357616.1 fumarylacetoacetate hydrolase family protein [Burkholderia cepacia]HDV6370358.1 fumarylacetoacetate hydrolase family protein [Burkholderia cepacia]